jgi:hypothetical protein
VHLIPISHLSRIKKPIYSHRASLFYSICKTKSMNSEVEMQLTLRNRAIANNKTQIGTCNSFKQIVKYLHRFLTLIYLHIQTEFSENFLGLFRKSTAAANTQVIKRLLFLDLVYECTSLRSVIQPLHFFFPASMGRSGRMFSIRYEANYD